jgi:hypothetical protein
MRPCVGRAQDRDASERFGRSRLVAPRGGVRPGDRIWTRRWPRDGAMATQWFLAREAAQLEGMRSAVSARRTLPESTASVSVK